jgi:hypothetical protein
MIEIKVIPDPVYIEKTALGLHLSFDFLLENATDHDWQIEQIELSALDSSGELTLRKTINTNGVRPGIETLGNRMLEKQSQLCVFNPFHTVPPDLTCEHLNYVFHFATETGDTYKSQVAVSPKFYDTQTDLCLPIRGRLIVLDGHDFYAHHRRVDISHPFLAQIMGLKTNSGRFSYDLCPVNAIGDLYVGDGTAEKEWFGLGESVYSPGDGMVMAVENTMQDNILGKSEFDFEQAAVVPNTLMGNYVLIDHLNGEYSVLAHLKQGSITVQKGTPVDRGQEIGQIGLSGSTGPWVHLHYELRTGVDLRSAKGLPVYFRSFFRFRGHEQFRIEKGHIDTGDIVESFA